MQHKRITIYIAGFLLSVPIALSIYVNSSFLSTFISQKYVSLVYALASVSSIAALFLSSKIFQRTGGYKFLLLTALLNAVCFLLSALLHSPLGLILVFVLSISLNTLLVFSLDELLKIFSNNSSTGKIRGIYLVVCHLAYIAMQLVSGTILGKFSFRAVYFIGFLVMLVFFFVSAISLRGMPDPSYDKLTFLKYLGKFFKNKNLLRAYIMSFLLHMFYAWMVIYTPIYLSLYLGLSWRQIGIIFAVMLLPFILAPFHLGKYSDKLGERKILMVGFFIASISTLSLFFIREPIVWLWAIMLFVTRIGAASMEVASDAYFFKHIKPENEELVGVFRTASPLAYIIGPMVAFVIFILVPSFNFIYPILATIMLYGIYLASTIRKSDV